MGIMSDKEIKTAYNDIIKDVTRYIIKWFIGAAFTLVVTGAGFYFKTISVQENHETEIKRTNVRVDRLETRMQDVATKEDIKEVKELMIRLDDKLESMR